MPLWAGKTPQYRWRGAAAAWLMVVALLFDALFPAALALAAPLGQQGSDGAFCGRPGTGPGSDSIPAAARHHCIFCFTAVSGIPPAAPTMLKWPTGARPTDGTTPQQRLTVRRAALAAQPRGPPGVA